jgi:hypothetical protein
VTYHKLLFQGLGVWALESEAALGSSLGSAFAKMLCGSGYTVYSFVALGSSTE